MYAMRPATTHDAEPIAALVRSRALWLRDRGDADWREFHDHAGVYAAQAADPDVPVWALIGHNGVLGVTSLYTECPPFLFTEDERAELSIFLATTVTDPAYAGRRLGCLIAWWTLDHAHHTGRTWVRRGTGPYPGLVRYYTDVQGWTLLRTVERKGATVHAFQRHAESQPGLADQITTQRVGSGRR